MNIVLKLWSINTARQFREMLNYDVQIGSGSGLANFLKTESVSNLILKTGSGSGSDQDNPRSGSMNNGTAAQHLFNHTET